MRQNRWNAAKRHWTQTFALLAGCKWIIAISLLMSLILFLPAQIRELYRIALADRIAVELVSLYAGTAIIALSLWLGALIVTRASLDQIVDPTALTSLVARLMPPMIAAAPPLASAAGHYASRPLPIAAAAAKFARTPGSPWENYDLILAKEIAPSLITASITIALGAMVGAAILALVNIGRPRSLLRGLVTYFADWRSIAITAVAIAALTLGYLMNLVPIATNLGVFGLLAIFTLSITVAITHLSVLTMRDNLPYIPALLVYALAISAFDANDNHMVRAVPAERSAKQLAWGMSPTAEWHFETWFRSRPDLADYPDGYPVYVVAAQGGGIYAAYQTAIFLARLQDVCPAFRNHLFAISSVSGGSLGAAAFTVSLPPLPAGAQASNSGEPNSPCPALARFIDGKAGFTPRGTDDAGDVEKRVRQLLTQDFLSPLIGSTLFPDFTQRFLFFPVPALDRAWALEQSFERAAQMALGDGPNPMQDSYLSHWTPTASSPALLLNTTNAATGVRVVIAPYALATRAGAGLTERTVGVYPFWPDGRLPENVRPLVPMGQAPEISLSTAIGISARFPWLTPAASVDFTDDTTKTHRKIRLVDGGYADNSGIETALDLMQDIKPFVQAMAAQTGSQKLPVPKVQLIALGGGGLPLRDSYGLGEIMEPVRGLLSTRQTRAYAAVERATTQFAPVAFGSFNFSSSSSTVTVPGMQRELLSNPFYDLPLGWSLSARSRDIIERQSGRYWECAPDEAFHQSEPGLSEADCMQVVIYHQLNRSLSKAAQDLSMLTAVSRQMTKSVAALPRIDHQKLIRCYRDSSMPAMNLPQNRALDGILTEWDRHPEWKDARWLAYILGTIVHESAGLRVQEESMDYAASSLQRVWPRIFDTADKAANFAHKPEVLANEVYASRLGNTDPGDGWRYRGRGLLQITGRSNYRRVGRAIGVDLEAQPELMIAPSIAGRVAVQTFIEFGALTKLPQFFSDTTEDWIGVRKFINGGLNGAEDVAVRSKQFMTCIKAAGT